MSCKRITGLLAILLVVTVAFEPLHTRSRTGISTRNAFQIMAPTEQGTYQFFHDLMGWIFDSYHWKHALFLSTSQKTTNAAIAANGKSHRNILEGALEYKMTLIKAGELLIKKRNNGFKSYSALTSSIADDASRRYAAKRLMQILSDKLTDNLILTATKREI